MNFSSKLLEKSVEQVSNLPGIGHKTALRLVLHLLKQPKEYTRNLTNSMNMLIENALLCQFCHNISDVPICDICSSDKRDKKMVCVVENVSDVMAIESTGQYNGFYHVLGGKISPMEGISPSDLYLETLKNKVKAGKIQELILALSATMEGDTTNFYIYKMLKKISCQDIYNL